MLLPGQGCASCWDALILGCPAPIHFDPRQRHDEFAECARDERMGAREGGLTCIKAPRSRRPIIGFMTAPESRSETLHRRLAVYRHYLRQGAACELACHYLREIV